MSRIVLVFASQVSGGSLRGRLCGPALTDPRLATRCLFQLGLAIRAFAALGLPPDWRMPLPGVAPSARSAVARLPLAWCLEQLERYLAVTRIDAPAPCGDLAVAEVAASAMRLRFHPAFEALPAAGRARLLLDWRAALYRCI